MAGVNLLHVLHLRVIRHELRRALPSLPLHTVHEGKRSLGNRAWPMGGRRGRGRQGRHRDRSRARRRVLPIIASSSKVTSRRLDDHVHDWDRGSRGLVLAPGIESLDGSSHLPDPPPCLLLGEPVPLRDRNNVALPLVVIEGKEPISKHQRRVRVLRYMPVPRPLPILTDLLQLIPDVPNETSTEIEGKVSSLHPMIPHVLLHEREQIDALLPRAATIPSHHNHPPLTHKVLQVERQRPRRPSHERES
mmetsp:Transcript_21044/g.70145  ORF Transcript_21044/g.70145 Transcript_21044/m.70145 type:complete len:248 (+) Transcript_21044:739-1482(+)